MGELVFPAEAPVTFARGPAPKPLKLAKVGIDEQGQVVLEKWTEQDFRENV